MFGLGARRKISPGTLALLFVNAREFPRIGLGRSREFSSRF